jgi:hypothetical protein
MMAESRAKSSAFKQQDAPDNSFTNDSPSSDNCPKDFGEDEEV